MSQRVEGDGVGGRGCAGGELGVWQRGGKEVATVLSVHGNHKAY